jgi:hypothetical protein
VIKARLVVENPAGVDDVVEGITEQVGKVDPGRFRPEHPQHNCRPSGKQPPAAPPPRRSRRPRPHGRSGPSYRRRIRQQLDAIAREVQQRAIAELRAKAGLRDVTVNVTIDDVIT